LVWKPPSFPAHHNPTSCIWLLKSLQIKLKRPYSSSNDESHTWRAIWHNS
jgi:hypothetical protein